MYEVRIARTADKALARLSLVMRKRIETALKALKEDPQRARPGVDIKLLKGHRQYYRLRVGDYRAFYFLDSEERIVSVVDVRHRRRAYD